MMKLTGFCIVLFAVLGLINDYSKRKREDIAMLYDFMLLLEKGAFYLAGERMKAPQFFSSLLTLASFQCKYKRKKRGV